MKVNKKKKNKENSERLFALVVLEWWIKYCILSRPVELNGKTWYELLIMKKVFQWIHLNAIKYCSHSIPYSGFFARVIKVWNHFE